MPNTLPLSQIVNVSVSVAAQQAVSPSFNLGLIISNENVIPSQGPTGRTRLYSTALLSQMLTDGFSPTGFAYLAASAYAAQTPMPTQVLIGVQDTTAIATVQPTTAHAGTGYTVGDIITPTQAGGSLAQLRVLAVTAGAVTSIAPIAGIQGTGYAVGTGLPTTGGTGTGLQVDILTIGETPLQAVTACRNQNSNWYLVTTQSILKADHIAIATYVQSAQPQAQYFFVTTDADQIAGASTSVGAALKALSLNRYQGITITTIGINPQNLYAAAAAMGMAMGRNTGLAGSYFSLPMKPLAGIAIEPMSVATAAGITAQFMNVYTNYNNAFPTLTPGQTGSGQYFDQILGFDMIGSDIQYAVANLLASVGAVPITDGGMTMIISAITRACDQANSRGFIASGIWTGPQVLNLVAGASVPNGYLVQCAQVATQSSSDRTARKSMPMYVAIVLAESVQSIIIGVYVQP